MNKSTPLRKRSTRKRKSPTTLDDTALIAKHSRSLRSQKHKYVSDAENKVSVSVGNNVTTKNRTWKRRSESSDLFDQDQEMPSSFKAKQPLLNANNTFDTETNGHFNDESSITSESSTEELSDNGFDKKYKKISTVPVENYSKRLRNNSSKQVNEKFNRFKPSDLDSNQVPQEKGVITFQDLLNIFKETQGQTQSELNESISKTAKSDKTSEADLYLAKTDNSTNKLLKSGKIQVHSNDTESSIVSNAFKNLLTPASADNKITNKNTTNYNFPATESSNTAQSAEQNSVKQKLNTYEPDSPQIPEPSSDEFSGSDSEVKVYLQKYKNTEPKSYTKVLRSSARKEKLVTATTKDNCSPKPSESKTIDSQENKKENYILKDSDTLDTSSTDERNNKTNVIEENSHLVICKNHTPPKIQSKDKHQKISQKQLFSKQDGCCSSSDEFGDLVIDVDESENEDNFSRKGSSLKQAGHPEGSKDAICKDILELEEEREKLSKKVSNSEENDKQVSLNELSINRSTTKFSKSVFVKYSGRTSSLCKEKNSVVTTGVSTEASFSSLSKESFPYFLSENTKSKKEGEKNDVFTVLNQNDIYEQPFTDWLMRGTPFVFNNIIKPLSSLSSSYDSWILKESRLKAISPLKIRKNNLLRDENFSLARKKSFQPLDFSHQKNYEISSLLNDGALSIFKNYIRPLKLKKLPKNLVKCYKNVNRSLKNRLNEEKKIVTKKLNDLFSVSTKEFSCDSTKNASKFNEKINCEELNNTNFHNNTSTMPNFFLNNCKHVNEDDLLKSKLNSLFSLNSINSDFDLTEQQSAVAEDFEEDFLLDNNQLSMSHSGADGSSEKLFFESTRIAINKNQIDGYQDNSFVIGNNTLSEADSLIKQNIFKQSSQISPVCALDKMGQDLAVSARFMSNLHNSIGLNDDLPFNSFGCKFLNKSSSKLEIDNFAKGTENIQMEVSCCINDLIDKIEENSTSTKKQNIKHSQQFQKFLSIKKKNRDPLTTTNTKKEVQKVLLLKPNAIRKKTTAKKPKTPILLRHKLLDLKKRNSLVGIESTEEREIDSLLSPKIEMDYLKYNDKDVLSLESPIPSFDDFKKLRKIQKANRKLQKSKKKKSEENYYQMQNGAVDSNCYEKTYVFDPSSSSPSSFKKRPSIVLPTVNNENSLSGPSTKQPDVSASHFEPFRNKS